MHYYESEPVGQLLPNGYGLYDIFGLVYEHVLFEERNPFKGLQGRPSCLKGGDHHVKKEYEQNAIDMFPYWKVYISPQLTEPEYAEGVTSEESGTDAVIPGMPMSKATQSNDLYEQAKEIVSLIMKNVINDCTIDDKYLAYANKIFPLYDRQNCERIYKRVSDLCIE